MKRINGGYGAPSQDELAHCKRCGAEIAWLTSKRTGKRYPANVTRSMNHYGAARVAAWNLHRCPAGPSDATLQGEEARAAGWSAK